MGDQQVQHGIEGLALGTLAGLSALTGSLNMDAARTSGVILKKFKGAFQLNGLTNGEGPILFGLSKDLSAAEVTEALNADPQGPGDIPATERGNRKVLPIGFWDENSLVPNGHPYMLRDLHWPWKELKENEGIQFFVFNMGSSALTTGGAATMQWTAVQEWFD